MTHTHTDPQTHTQTLVFIGRALLRNVPFKNGIKIRAFVAELLHLKERGQKCDRQTDRHTYIHTYTHTHLLLRPLPYGRGLKKHLIKMIKNT